MEGNLSGLGQRSGYLANCSTTPIPCSSLRTKRPVCSLIGNNNLEAISNTSDDILNGYLEMKNFIETKELSKDIDDLNKLVFDSFKDKNYANYLFEETKIRIPENFLKKYKDLI